MRIAPLAPPALLILLLLGPARDTQAGPAPSKEPATRERDTAIGQGMGYLDKTVFKLPDASGTPRKQFTVAMTGLVHLLAHQGGRRTDGRKSVTKARAYLSRYVDELERRTADPAQLPARTGSFSSDRVIQYTWPLAMTALFLGEAHQRGVGTAAARKELGRIVPLLVKAQAPNGGWGHGKVTHQGRARGSSKMDGFGSYPDTLVASSNLVGTSLGLVRGIITPRPEGVLKKALESARAYYRYAELANGNFPYDPSQRSAHKSLTGVSRAAGAVLSMHALDIPWSDVGIVRALEFVDAHFDYLAEGHGSSTHNLLLAALMQRARGDTPWRRFKRAYFRRLLDGQQPDGSFECICENKAFGSTNDSKPFGGKVARAGGAGGLAAMFGDATKAYVTAAHTLILLLDRAPLRLLDDRLPKRERGPVTPGSTGR